MADTVVKAAPICPYIIEYYDDRSKERKTTIGFVLGQTADSKPIVVLLAEQMRDNQALLQRAPTDVAEYVYALARSSTRKDQESAPAITAKDD